MAVYSNAQNMLGFGMPDFQSPHRGSGARMSRYIPSRSRLVRLRGTGPKWPPVREFKTRMRGLGEGEEYLDWGAGNPSGVYGPVVTPWQTVSIWGTNEAAGGSQTVVPSQTGGTTTAPTSVLRDITALLQAGQQAVAQQRIIDLNIARARQGLAPVDPRYFSPSAAVNFGLTPQASQMLLIGGVALVALMALRRK